MDSQSDVKTAPRNPMSASQEEGGLVFLSHTGQDETARNFAAHLKRTLDEKRIPAFYDVDTIPYTVEYAKHIENHVKQCAVFVAILSPTYFERHWCMLELYLALTHGRRVLPVYYAINSDKEFPQDKDAFCGNFSGKKVEEKELHEWWISVHEKLPEIQGPRKSASTKKNADVALIDEIVKSLKELLPHLELGPPEERSLGQQLNAIGDKADTILAKVSRKRPACDPPNSLLPESPPLYGREEELKQLGEVLGTGGRIAALVGGAGMGKSHCASHFARQWLREDAGHRFVLWLESDTENVIRVSYSKALEKAWGEKVPDSEEETSIGDIARLAWNKLSGESTQFEWMVVYNNAPEVLGDSEGPEAFSSLFFPTPMEDWGRGRILLTTRSTSYAGRIKSLGNHHVTKIPVESLDESTSVTMLMDNLNDASDSEMKAAEAVVELFGYLPLAIVTANSLMVAETLTVSEYLDDLKAGLAESDVHDAVSLALANALAYARSHGLGDVLEVAAFLSPNQLSLELLDCDRKTARRLCRLSLLRHTGDNVYTMHRLHQEAAREGASPSKAITAANRALDRFDGNISDTWKFGIAMIPHLEALEKTVGSFITPNLEYARLLASKALVLQSVLYNYGEARSYYQQSLEMQRHIYGPEAKNTNLAAALGNLGILEKELGNYEKALSYYQEALEMDRQVCGPEAMNSDLAGTLGNLGSLEYDLGNYDKARSYCEESLEMERHVYGPEAKNTALASALNNLGNLELELGNYGKARSYYQQSLEMQRHVYGPEAKNTYLASILGNLGVLEKDLGNYDKARSYYDESLEMKRQVYGPDAKSSNLAATLNNLGLLERKLGNYERARENYVEALDMATDSLGEDASNHPMVETIRKNLAILG